MLVAGGCVEEASGGWRVSRRHQEGAEDADERGGEAVHHADAAVW